MHFKSGRLGFRFRPPAQAGSLLGACDSIPLYIPNASDSYTLSQELSTPNNTMATISNGYIRYTVNGNNRPQGQIGNASTGPGIQFDSTGTGNYGTDDYIRPGTPHEAYGFYVNNTTWIGGDNSGSGSYLAGSTTMWNKSTASLNHVICMRGNQANGFVVTQYQTYPNEALIRMKMSYTNTTGSAVTLKAYRGCDPDVGAIQYGIYNTTNYRGYSSVPATDIVVAEESQTGKPIALYVPGNGYAHNTAVISAWPSQAVDTMLSGTNNGNGDYAIYAAWDFGTVAAGATVAVCCYYILGTNIGDVVTSIF
jgi:hypothetical protein